MSSSTIAAPNQGFWKSLDVLFTSPSRSIVIERPLGSAHPRYSNIIYPLDYGYLENTRSSDGGCIDAWIGSSDTKTIDAIIVTIDLDKADSEIKVLVGFTSEEMEVVNDFHNKGTQSGILIVRDDAEMRPRVM